MTEFDSANTNLRGFKSINRRGDIPHFAEILSGERRKFHRQNRRRQVNRWRDKKMLTINWPRWGWRWWQRRREPGARWIVQGVMWLIFSTCTWHIPLGPVRGTSNQMPSTDGDLYRGSWQNVVPVHVDLDKTCHYYAIISVEKSGLQAHIPKNSYICHVS